MNMKLFSKALKKTVSLLVVLTLLLAIGLTASAATITDNFSSGKIEDRWTNGYIDGTYNATLNPDSSDDLELKGIAKIEGGVLKINNYTTGGSFFYLAPKAPGSDKGVVVRNFEVSFKVKLNTKSDAWVGLSVRKKTNDRYNGTNNVLMVFRLQDSGIVLQANRSYGGNDLTSFKKDTNIYDKPFEGDVTKWNTIKLVVKDDIYTGYVNDVKIGEFKYDKVNDAGFLSINACVADIDIDDFKLVSDDISTSAATTTTTTKKQSTTASTTKKTDGGGNQITTPTSSQDDNGDTTTDPDLPSTDITDGSETSTDKSVTTSVSKDTAVSSDTDKENKKIPVIAIVIIAVIVLAGIGAAVYFFVIKNKNIDDGDLN